MSLAFFCETKENGDKRHKYTLVLCYLISTLVTFTWANFTKFLHLCTWLIIKNYHKTLINTCHDKQMFLWALEFTCSTYWPRLQYYAMDNKLINTTFP